MDFNNLTPEQKRRMSQMEQYIADVIKVAVKHVATMGVEKLKDIQDTDFRAGYKMAIDDTLELLNSWLAESEE